MGFPISHMDSRSVIGEDSVYLNSTIEFFPISPSVSLKLLGFGVEACHMLHSSHIGLIGSFSIKMVPVFFYPQHLPLYHQRGGWILFEFFTPPSVQSP